MPTNSAISIESLNNDNKKVTNKISYVNPNLSNAKALELAQKIAALTTDSYQKADRIDTTNLDATYRQRNPTIKIAGKTLTNNTVRIGFSELQWSTSANLFGLGPTISTELSNKQPTVLPDFVDITSSNPDTQFKISSVNWYNNYQNVWSFGGGPTGANADDKKEVTFTFHIEIPEGDGFDYYISPLITIEIYNDNT